MARMVAQPARLSTHAMTMASRLIWLSTATAAMPVTSLMRGPERRRQGAVVGQVPSICEDIARRISKHRSEPRSPLAPSKTRRPSLMTIRPVPRDAPEEFFRHDVERTIVPDRQRDVVPLGAGLGAGQVHDAFPRAADRIDVGDRNGCAGPRLAQPTSEFAKPTITVMATTLRTDRRPLRLIGPPVRAHGFRERKTHSVDTDSRAPPGRPLRGGRSPE